MWGKGNIVNRIKKTREVFLLNYPYYEDFEQIDFADERQPYYYPRPRPRPPFYPPYYYPRPRPYYPFYPPYYYYPRPYYPWQYGYGYGGRP
ncbi:spore coat protein [Bacillus atrophaeus]|nr:spore coat protein [Bacillus atrophaeus]